MALAVKEVAVVPPSSYRKGPRASRCRDVVDQAKAASSHKVAVTSANSSELTGFYKSMVQWAFRHKPDEPSVRVRKDKDTVFVWIEEPASE